MVRVVLGVPSEPPVQPPSGTASSRVHRVVLAVIIGLLVVTLVFAVVSVAVLIDRGLLSGDQGPAEAAPSPTTTAESEPDPPSESPPSQDATEAGNEQSDSQALTEATVEGWQGVAVRRRPLVYDVPGDWVVESPGMMYGFEEEDPDAPLGYSTRVIMSGVAYWPEADPACEDTGPDSGAIGTSGMGEVVDTAAGADGVAREWADAAYEHDGGDPELSVGAPEPFEANGLEGHAVTVDVTPEPADCYPESAQVRVASVDYPEEDDVYNLIVYADTSGPLAPDGDDLDTMLTTLRPQEGWVEPED